MNNNSLYQRNVIKERLQDEILNFVYNNRDYNGLIFTGGTCLRKVYGLNRLSEDLDFDYSADFPFDINKFAKDAGKYLAADTKISGNGGTVFVKFPDNIFVRCDFSLIAAGEYQTQKSLITADNRQFFVNAYDLTTLFANKIVAFLSRNFFKGKFQKIPFKGRDIYDIYWLLQLSAKTGYTLKPNIPRLIDLLKKNSLPEIKNLVKDKIGLVNTQFVYDDLYPLIESKEFLGQFLQDFGKTIKNQLDYVLI
ncbi:MAG: hypothetical protein ACD_12C00317G0001 [uncultured bacterium]|nr:MAG: hypothetical protein ACD_12C00317G0001 [uncultured bacterium]